MIKELYHHCWVNKSVTRYCELLFDSKAIFPRVYRNKVILPPDLEYGHLYICIIPTVLIHFYWLVKHK